MQEALNLRLVVDDEDPVAAGLMGRPQGDLAPARPPEGE